MSKRKLDRADIEQAKKELEESCDALKKSIKFLYGNFKARPIVDMSIFGTTNWSGEYYEA